MKALKIPVILILSVILLVLGALLPMATGWIQDGMESEEVRYAPISELQLKLYSGDMTILQKIAVAAKTEDAYPVPTGMASMTTSEALKKVTEALDPYQELGMLGIDIDLNSQLKNITPILLYTTGENERSFVCWGVELQTDRWSMDLVIDDETGTLISISYTVLNKFGGYAWDWTSPDVMMDVLLQYFYDIYTGALGEEFIISKLRPETPTFAWEEQTIYCPIQWEDAQLGDITLILRVTPYGFNTTIY